MAPISSAAAEEHLPLKPAVFHILLALANQEAHGYALRQTVLEQSGGRIRLATGPFYRYLGKIFDLGFVTESERRPADDDVRRGSYYRLTPLGRAVLKAESARLAGVLSISKKLGLLPRAGAK
jgi:DNA-binding PadR family transcriptional regulator